MNGTRSARVDVPPVSWEIPTAGAAVWLLASLLIFPAGQGVAAWLVGGGWVWPRGSAAVMSSIGGLVTGNLGRGVAGSRAGLLPEAAAVYVVVVVGELLLLAVTIWGVVLWWRHLGPGALHGMAGRAEVENVLGLSRLRRGRRLIRPDLYGSSRDPAGPVSLS